MLFGDEDLGPENPQLKSETKRPNSRRPGPFWDVGYWPVVFHDSVSYTGPQGQVVRSSFIKLRFIYDSKIKGKLLLFSAEKLPHQIGTGAWL